MTTPRQPHGAVIGMPAGLRFAHDESVSEETRLTMTEFHVIRECRSRTNAARRCEVRVVSTEPWVICERGGLRFLLPGALAVDGSAAEHGPVLVPDWTFNELAAATAWIDVGDPRVAPDDHSTRCERIRRRRGVRRHV
jgi:hypothetical protein